MFSSSLSKGLISILQHHFQDNFSDQFSRHVLPSLLGVTHFWWQRIDYKETEESVQRFGGWLELDEVRLQSHETLFPELPFMPHIRNEYDGHSWLSLFSEWLFCQSWTWWNVNDVSQSLHLSFVMVINYPGDHSAFSKNRLVSWEAPQAQANRDSWSPYSFIAKEQPLW